MVGWKRGDNAVKKKGDGGMGKGRYYGGITEMIERKREMVGWKKRNCGMKKRGDMAKRGGGGGGGGGGGTIRSKKGDGGWIWEMVR